MARGSFTQHPAYCIDDVRLAASVRADDAHQLAGYRNRRRVYKRLESRKIDMSKAQCVTLTKVIIGIEISLNILTDLPLADNAKQAIHSARNVPQSRAWPRLPVHGVAYRAPERFPIGTVAPLRAFYWTHDRDPRQAVALAKALYTAYFAENRDISSPETTIDVARSVGVDAAALAAALQDPAVKDRARKEANAAIAAGVFGSPYFIVDGEPFWGVDRMPMLEEWIRRGGW